MRGVPPNLLNTKAKPGDPCPYCRENKLGPSASGRHLMCYGCGRTVIVAPLRSATPEAHAKRVKARWRTRRRR